MASHKPRNVLLQKQRSISLDCGLDMKHDLAADQTVYTPHDRTGNKQSGGGGGSTKPSGKKLKSRSSSVPSKKLKKTVAKLSPSASFGVRDSEAFSALLEDPNQEQLQATADTKRDKKKKKTLKRRSKSKNEDKIWHSLDSYTRDYGGLVSGRSQLNGQYTMGVRIRSQLDLGSSYHGHMDLSRGLRSQPDLASLLRDHTDAALTLQGQPDIGSNLLLPPAATSAEPKTTPFSGKPSDPNLRRLSAPRIRIEEEGNTCSLEPLTGGNIPKSMSQSQLPELESTGSLDKSSHSLAEHSDLDQDNQRATTTPDPILRSTERNLEFSKKDLQSKKARKQKSREEKFHRIFTNVPMSEHVLKSYMCAYVGDILLQGYLYISPNYFCFYTKILGHEKQLEIRVSDVTDITREKTAGFIPNAIGVLTQRDKFVFGSLISRDSAYRVMQRVHQRPGQATAGPYDADDKGTDTGSRSQSDDEDDDDDDDDDALDDDDTSSVCSECGYPWSEHDAQREATGQEQQPPGEVSAVGGNSQSRTAGQNTDSGNYSGHFSSTRRKNSSRSNVRLPAGFFLSLALIVCLAVSTLFIAMKSLKLQSQLETNKLWLADGVGYHKISSILLEAGVQHDDCQKFTADRLRLILNASATLLTQIQASLNETFGLDLRNSTLGT